MSSEPSTNVIGTYGLLRLDPLYLERAEIRHYGVRKDRRYPEDSAWSYETPSRHRYLQFY